MTWKTVSFSLSFMNCMCQVWAKITNHMKQWSNMDASAQAWFDQVPFQCAFLRTCKAAHHHSRSPPIHSVPSKWHGVFSWNVLVASGKEATFFSGNPFNGWIRSEWIRTLQLYNSNRCLFPLNRPVSGQQTQLPPVRFRSGCPYRKFCSNSPRCVEFLQQSLFSPALWGLSWTWL